MNKKNPTYLPYFFRTVTGNKQLIFLCLDLLTISNLRWMKGWICSERPITIWQFPYDYPRGLKSGLSVTSLGDKNQWGFLYLLHYRESCTPACAEHKSWAFRHSLVVQVDRLVSYGSTCFYSSKIKCLAILAGSMENKWI